MICIVGSGLGGLSAAYHLEKMEFREYILLEKRKSVGGLSGSWEENGYVFDYGPHIIYTNIKYMKRMFRNLLRKNMKRHLRKNYIRIYGTEIKYPFETFMKGLPSNVIEECIIGVLGLPEMNEKKIKNFEDWIYANFGEGIAKHYFIPYNKKVWKYPLSEMSIKWIHGRVPRPDVRDMIRGVLGTQKKEFGPNAYFWYPIRGGIGVLAEAMRRKIRNLSVNSKVYDIKCSREITVKWGDGKSGTFEKVISSIPLPEIVDIMDVPSDVYRAAKSLVFNKLHCTVIGVNRKKLTNYHSLYFPEKNVLFNRISFPKNMSRYSCPSGKSSIIVETTLPMNKRIMGKRIAERVMDDLMREEILKEKDVEFFTWRSYEYAYVIYDLNYDKNVSRVHEYLIDNKIIPCGRFGLWQYLNMDKTIMSGKDAAEKALKSYTIIGKQSFRHHSG